MQIRELNPVRSSRQVSGILLLKIRGNKLLNKSSVLHKELRNVIKSRFIIAVCFFSSSLFDSRLDLLNVSLLFQFHMSADGVKASGRLAIKAEDGPETALTSTHTQIMDGDSFYPVCFKCSQPHLMQ